MNTINSAYANASPHEQSFYNIGGQSEGFATEFFSEGRKQIEESNAVISDEGSFQIWPSVVSIIGKIYKHSTEVLLFSTTFRAFSKSHNQIHQIFPQDIATKMGSTFTAASLSAESIYDCIIGLKEKEVSKILGASVKAFFLWHSYDVVKNLSPKATIVIHETALLAFASGHVAAAGIRDISQRSFVKGSCKFLLGASGLTYSAYHLYDYLFPNSTPMDIRLQSFVNQHFNDTGIIKEMQKELGGYSDVGLWKSLGRGISKRVYAHPELPDYVLKMDHYIWPSGYSPSRDHFENTKYARDVIEVRNYDKLQVPLSYLLETNGGALIFEEKIISNNTKYTVNEDAIRQLEKFLLTTGFVDVNIYNEHNAYWTSGGKIALFDFDAKSSHDFLARDRERIQAMNFHESI